MNSTTIDLAQLPAKLVDRAIDVSGKRTPKTLILWALENATKVNDAEPLTPAQCRASRAAAKAAGVRLKVDPRLAAHGITESDLWGL